MNTNIEIIGFAKKDKKDVISYWKYAFYLIFFEYLFMTEFKAKKKIFQGVRICLVF